MRKPRACLRLPTILGSRWARKTVLPAPTRLVTRPKRRPTKTAIVAWSFRFTTCRTELDSSGRCAASRGGGGAVNSGGEGNGQAISGGPIQQTTNQGMEVVAAIEALKRIKEGSTATLFSDSLYVINAMSKGWKRRAKHDLWAELDAL